MATGIIQSTLPDGANTMFKKIRFTATEYTVNKTSSSGTAQYYYAVTAGNLGLVAPEGYKIAGICRFGTGSNQVAVSAFTPATPAGNAVSESTTVLGLKWYRNNETSSVKMPDLSPTIEILFVREGFIE